MVYPLPEPLKPLVDEIDRLNEEAIQYADKRCRSLKMGNVPYSPNYTVLTSKLAFWKSLQDKKEGAKISSRVLVRLLIAMEDKTPLRIYKQYSIAEMREEEREANRALRRFKKHDADTSRTNFLEDLAEARAADRRTKMAANRQQAKHNAKTYSSETELRSLIKRERTRKTWARISRAIGKERLAGLMIVEAPNEDGTWSEVTEKNEIEEACINENKRRFTQCHNTPFLQSPLIDDFGYLGVGEAAGRVLDGTYTPPPGSDPYACRLLKGLQRIAPTQPTGFERQDYQG